MPCDTRWLGAWIGPTNFHAVLLRGRQIFAPHAEFFGLSCGVCAVLVLDVAFLGGDPGEGIVCAVWCPVMAYICVLEAGRHVQHCCQCVYRAGLQQSVFDVGARRVQPTACVM